MATITLRSVKGSPLTNNEVDQNFTNLNNDKLETSSYTAADVLSKLLTVDGASSGLDADTLDGLNSATANTVSTIVARDASGNFAAGTITAALTGTASIATTVTLLATNSTNATHFINFTDSATGDENIRTDTDLTYNPSTGTLVSTVFSGSGASLSALNASNVSSGTLAVARGGTAGSATPTDGAVAYGTGSAYAFTLAGTAGQVLTSSGTGSPTWTTPSPGINTGKAIAMAIVFGG